MASPAISWRSTSGRELKAEERQAKGLSTAPADLEIKPADVRYYMRLPELKKYSVDDQVLKKSFPLDGVTSDLMEIYQRARAEGRRATGEGSLHCACGSRDQARGRAILHAPARVKEVLCGRSGAEEIFPARWRHQRSHGDLPAGAS